MKYFPFSLKAKKFAAIGTVSVCALLAGGALFFGGLLSGRSSGKTAADGAKAAETRDENAAFDEFTEGLFRTQLCENTLNLHYTLAHPEDFGVTDYTITLGDYSLAAMEEGLSGVKNCLDTLESFDYDALSSDRQLTYDCMQEALSTELGADGVLEFSELLSPTTGFQAQLPILLAEYPFYDAQDVEDYLQLLSEVPSYFSQILDFERQKAADGLFMPFYAVEDIVAQCASLLEDQENHFLVTTFADRLDTLTLTDEEREAYITQNKAALTDSFFPAYETLVAGLRDLESAGANPYGLCYYENGKTYYEYLVAVNTGCSDSIDDMYDDILTHLHEMADAQEALLTAHPEVLLQTADAPLPVAGDTDGTDVVANASDSTKSTDTGDTDGTNNSTESADTNSTVIRIDPNTYLADLQEKSAADFPALSGVSYTVRAVDTCLEDYLSPAFYLTPTLDADAQNVIYINHGHAYTALSLYTTLAHEGFPGHLYQNVTAQQTPLANVRALFSFTGYAEGWATYAEQFAYGYAGINENTAALYQNSAQMSLALSAAADIGIHYYYWTPDDTADFLADYGITDETAVAELYEYIVEEPANYLNYEIGYLQFVRLRTIAQNALGDSFDLKTFHEAVLAIGEAPFSVVEKYMRQLLGIDAD